MLPSRRTDAPALGRHICGGDGSREDEWTQLSASYRRHGVIHALVPWIIAHPKFTVADARRGIGRGTHPAMSGAIRELIDLGLVGPAGAKGQERLYQAPPVIDLFEKVPTIGIRGP